MVQSIGAEKARELMAREPLDLVDVRESGEWSAGHLPGARHVPLSRLRGSAKEERSMGFAKVYNLSGGTRGWVRAGLPLVQEL